MKKSIISILLLLAYTLEVRSECWSEHSKHGYYEWY